MPYGRSEPNYLFSEGDIFTVTEGRKKQIETEINGLDRNRILNVSIEDLCSYIEEKFRLETPTLHEDQAFADQNEGTVEIWDTWRFGRDRGDGPLRVTGTIVELTVPFTGDPQLFRVRPSTFTTTLPVANVQGSTLIFKVTGRDMNAGQVKDELNRQLKMVNEYLGWLRNGTVPFNASIRDYARGLIERRRQKLLADQSLVSALGFPLRIRGDAPRTYAAPIERRRIEPRAPAASTAPFKPEPVLQEPEYNNILDIMTNMALVMERSPSAFATIDEEDLRQHFLVQLNGQYEGQATGETFNYQGKTDILIRADGRNIFIAECKYWRGEKGYTDTIDQILSYMSWRDTKAALVLFNRNKNFSGVLEKIQVTTAAHPLRKSGPKIESETRFRYIFGQKADPNREVVLTVLAFDVPQPEASIVAGAQSP
jgi:hypothetical protein